MEFIHIFHAEIRQFPAAFIGFGALFEGRPDISIWAESDWASF
jgi:hypothetical protein